MAKYLTQEEMDQMKLLKEMEVLLPVNPDELKTKNGGILILCGDGDIDAGLFHRQRISNRPHGIRVFGGPLVLAPSFEGYNTAFAEGLVHNMTLGMGAKNTRSFFVKPHWPCGVGSHYGLTMINALNLMSEVERTLLRVSPKIVMLFHVAKFRDGQEEQNTYRLILPKGGIVL